MFRGNINDDLGFEQNESSNQFFTTDDNEIVEILQTGHALPFQDVNFESDFRFSPELEVAAKVDGSNSASRKRKLDPGMQELPPTKAPANVDANQQTSSSSTTQATIPSYPLSQVVSQMIELDAHFRERQFISRNFLGKDLASKLPSALKERMVAAKKNGNLANSATFFSKPSALEMTNRLISLRKGFVALRHAKLSLQMSIANERKKLMDQISTLTLLSANGMTDLLEKLKKESQAKECVEEKNELMGLVMMLENELRNEEMLMAGCKREVDALTHEEQRLQAQNRLLAHSSSSVRASLPRNRGQ